MWRQATIGAAAVALVAPHSLLWALHAERPPEADRTAVVLERVSAYMERYEKALSNLVAREELLQISQDYVSGPAALGAAAVVMQTRRTTSEVVMVWLAGGGLPWATFRDVLEVDGRPVRDRDGRLPRILGQAGGLPRARQILDESARFNIGRFNRNFDVPTLPLTFLSPGLRSHFEFRLGNTDRIEGHPAVQIRFEERASPTIVLDGEHDVRSRGRYWVDADDGTVLRTELYLEPAGHAWNARMETTYGWEPRLSLWVPVGMTERFEGRGRPSDTASWQHPVLEATARYSEYARFQVEVEESVAGP